MNDMQKIRAAFVASYLKDDRTAEAEALLPHLTADGRFDHLDYSINLNSNWPTSQSLAHAFVFSAAWAQTEDARYLAAATAVLDDWLAHRYRNPNWWHMQIGIPMNLTKIALLLWDQIGERRQAGVLEMLDEGSFGAHPEYMEKWTGANLIWEAATTIKVALLREDDRLLRTAVDRLAREIDYAPEGIQKDGSFFQHGPLLYSGGYGRSLIVQMSELLSVLSGTIYQLPQEKLDLLLFHLLDGLRFMTHRDRMDAAITGREYTRKGGLSAMSMLPALDRLIAVPEMPRKEELIAYRSAIAERKTMPQLPAVRYFPIARYLTCRSGECFFSFKGASPDTLCTEHCNEEGVLGYNLSYGSRTAALRTGREYDDIAPVLNYARIPGTTAPEESYDALYAKKDLIRRPLSGRHFGGAQKGDYAVCFEDADREGVRARIACFASPAGLILLGCGVVSENGSPLITTAEQCLAQGAPTESGRSVCHGGIRYQNLDPEERLVAVCAEQSGSWRRNNRQISDRTPIRKTVFTLTVDRSGKDSYAYAILPEEIGEQAITVLKNDKEAQAVALPDGKILAAFYRGGTFKLGEQTVSVKEDEIRFLG